MGTILMATDGSSSAQHALELAARHSAALRTGLAIVTVFSRRHIEDLKAFSRAEQAALGDVLEGESRKFLAAARAKAISLGATDVVAHERHGDPAAEILALARELRANEIVVGRRGRGLLEGLLLGSVSQKLVTLAPCPVVVVP